MNVRSHSVAVVVLAALVAVETVLLVTAGATNYANYRANGQEALRRGLATEAAQLAVGLALPVWNIDRAGIDRVLAAEEADRSVYGVRLEAAAKSHAWVRDSRWQLVPARGPFPTEGLLAEERVVTFGGEKIGSFTIYATTRFLDEDLGRMRRTIIARIILFDTLLVLSLYFVLRHTVLKPLTDIERFATAVSAEKGAGAAAISLSKGAARELASLRASIEAMVGLLRSRYDEVLSSEKKYRDIVDFSPVGICQVRPEGEFLMVNAALAHVLGYATPEDVMALNLDREIYADPADRARLREKYEPIGYTGRVEVRLKRRDGSLFWAELVAHAVKDDSGRSRYFQGFIQDITARHEAEAAVRASEERYRLLFEGNPVPMLVYDLDSLAFLAANQAAVEQYGYALEELLALRVTDLALPGDPHLATFLSTRFDPRPQIVHVGRRQQRRKDGTILDVDATSLIVLFDGRPARLLLCRDMTAEALAQAEQERLQESLRRSESMAAMGGLVAGVAHEVRNPLFSISATVDALETELQERPDFMELAGLLRSQVARLTQLMRDLLDYGKPAALSLAVVPPGDPVKVAMRACASLGRVHDVELKAEVAPGLPALVLDAGRMEQVLENLLANAVQHAPRRTLVRLSARLAEGEAAVEFRVEDEGPGIPPEDLERLFEPFFSRRKGGTGLGLPIVQRIVDAHGGVIRAANRPEGGAVFTVSLPVPTREAVSALDQPGGEHGAAAGDRAT